MRRSGVDAVASAAALWIASTSCAAPFARGLGARARGPVEHRPRATTTHPAPAPIPPGHSGDAPSEREKEPAPPSSKGEIVAARPLAQRRSRRLPSGFHNPMPGGILAGYRADTGLDIAGSPRAVYAIAAGTLDYSEPGHTRWVGPRDTANTVRMELAEAISWRGRKITHLWYAHLSALEHQQSEGSVTRRRIEAGEQLGISGIANHSPHLHIGMLLDNEVNQAWGTFLLEHEIREVLGGYKHRAKLPEEAEQGEARAALLGAPDGPADLELSAQIALRTPDAALPPLLPR